MRHLGRRWFIIGHSNVEGLRVGDGIGGSTGSIECPVEDSILSLLDVGGEAVESDLPDVAGRRGVFCCDPVSLETR
jgi:hypothetical protein